MFVTPYDRDDLSQLAFAVDDVADAAENAAELLGLYGVETPTRQSFELCALLVRATSTSLLLLARAAPSSRRLAATSSRSRRSRTRPTTSRAPRARASSRTTASIPLIVIRWKDIYEALEDAIDACDTAASRVGNILVKNA